MCVIRLLEDLAARIPGRVFSHRHLGDRRKARTFAAIVRQPIRIGKIGRCAADRHKITAGGLNTLLRALRTLATHATDEAIIFRRRAADVIAEFDYERRPFYAHARAAEELGYLTRQPAGKRGVVEYRMPRAVRTVPLLATSHYHHQEELASRKQIRKACALDRAASRQPDEARYAAMSRTALWDRYKVVNFIGVTVCNSIPRETHRGPDVTPVGYSPASSSARTRSPVAVRTFPMRSTMVSIRRQRGAAPVRRDVTEEPVLEPVGCRSVAAPLPLSLPAGAGCLPL